MFLVSADGAVFSAVVLVSGAFAIYCGYGVVGGRLWFLGFVFHGAVFCVFWGFRVLGGLGFWVVLLGFCSEWGCAIWFLVVWDFGLTGWWLC